MEGRKMARDVRLVKVDAKTNANKAYVVIVSEDGCSFTAHYGRMGGDGLPVRHTTYGIEQYDKIVNKRIEHGYREVGRTSKKREDDGDALFRGITDRHVERVLRLLVESSGRHFDGNYSVGVASITTEMVDEAQRLLDRVANSHGLRECNDNLTRLFEVIPRRMARVGDYLAKSPRDIGRIVETEQTNIDVVRAQLKTSGMDDDNDDAPSDANILDRLGITMRYADVDTMRRVRRTLDGGLHERIDCVFEVGNAKTRKAFDEWRHNHGLPRTKMLWHGSRNENWASILSDGLVLHPRAKVTGKMFGSGIYFATSAKKSYNYTSANGSYWAGGKSDTGLMAMFECSYGNPYDVRSNAGFTNSFGYDNLRRKRGGYDCVHAHAGEALRNDEIVFYRPEQTDIRYLVTFKA